jgi:two-component system, NtrC family, response regulator AtoC
MAAPTVVDPKRSSPDGSGPAVRNHLVVLGRDGATPRALPSAGQVLIGRDEDADVRIIDQRASRHHARLTIGDGIEIEDLSSANGTRLRDVPLEAGKRVALSRGDVVTIGSTMLVLCAGEPELEARRVWAHGYLETRLIEECARAANRGSELALARIHIQGKAPPELVEEVFAGILRDGDLLAAYAPAEYEVLLRESEAAGARALTDQIVAALAARSIASNAGLACYPADGASPQALLGHAVERVRGSGRGAGAKPTPTPSRGVVIESRVMRELYALAERAAAGNSNVLILGETGVGKEILAETVHRASPRSGKPFVPLNCAALSETGPRRDPDARSRLASGPVVNTRLRRDLFQEAAPVERFDAWAPESSHSEREPLAG